MQFIYDAVIIRNIISKSNHDIFYKKFELCADNKVNGHDENNDINGNENNEFEDYW